MTKDVHDEDPLGKAVSSRMGPVMPSDVRHSDELQCVSTILLFLAHIAKSKLTSKSKAGDLAQCCQRLCLFSTCGQQVTIRMKIPSYCDVITITIDIS